jgi:hypothetical protein
MQVTVKAKKYNKPQINIGGSGFIYQAHLRLINHIKPQSTQRAQSSAITTYEKASASRFRTRMTRIARIFTDIIDQSASMFNPQNNKPQISQRTQDRIANLCVLCGGLTLYTVWMTRIYPYPCVSASSAQSAFYYPPSVFCVHPRLILSIQKKTAAFYYSLIYKVNTIFNPKSDLNDRYILLQRA